MSQRLKLQAAARLLLGLIFTVFGLNGFFHFIPQPPAPAAAMAFGGALAATGYMFPLIKGTEVAVGVLLLAGRFVPLALTVLAPIVVNIVAFHLFLAPAGLALPIVIVLLGVYLAWTERAAYAPLFHTRNEAAAASVRPGTPARVHG